MRRKNSFVLDEKDNKAVQLFEELGMPRNLAKTLLYVSQVDECRSVDIEYGADLRQPEVSVAIQELRRRGWVTKRDLKKKGKGRPVHIYKSTTRLSDILKNLEKKKLKEIENVKRDMAELKSIIESRY
jgi:predicted transcriptional regulator